LIKRDYEGDDQVFQKKSCQFKMQKTKKTRKRLVKGKREVHPTDKKQRNEGGGWTGTENDGTTGQRWKPNAFQRGKQGQEKGGGIPLKGEKNNGTAKTKVGGKKVKLLLIWGWDTPSCGKAVRFTGGD